MLSNAVLSNLQVENAALTNNVLTNNVLSNVVLTNAALTNNVLSNAVLSNVVLSNNSLNAALTNLDPANVALSNAALTNNALTNVALTNNVLTNAMLTNAALTNAALTNAALSNAALTNNVLTNNALSNVVLSNAPLADTSGGLNEKRDADPLRTIEPAAFEIAKNDFNAGDLGNSNFRETTFSIRNHGNTDTTLSVKLMLRDAVCTGNVQTGPYTCSPPAGYKLQLILRKVGFVPSAIAPTKPAKDTGRVFRLGLVQRNTEVSNIGNLPIISPEDVNFGKFLADDPSAATLPLAAGEWAYATIRAIGTGGTSPPDPADLLRWGVKTVSANSTSADGPLVIRTLSFPLTPAFVAGDQATPAFRAFGGTPQVTGSAVCSDKDGNFILQGTGAPAVALGAAGNFYIDTAAEMVFGPKGGPGTTPQAPWVSVSPASPTPQIGVAQPGDLQTGPKAGFACPPAGIAVTNPFVTDANRNSTTTLTFTPKFLGEFFMRAGVFDSTNALMPKDEQVIRAVVQPRPPVVAFTDFLNDVAPQRTYNNNGLGTNLRPLVSSDSKNGFGVAQRIVLGASGSCHMSDADNLVIDRATFPIANPADCIVTVHQDGNEIYAPVNVTKPIFIERALQTIDATQLPVDNNLTFNNGNLPFTLIASVRSTTAPNSGLAVTYTSSTPAVCTTGGDNGASLTITGSGTCTIAADQAGDPNYKPLLTFARSFFIRKADQNITFGTAPSATFNTPFVVSATSASPTAPAPPSGIPITFSSLTTPVCTVNGATVTVVAAGNCTIAANQVGNGNYNAAPQVTQNITIARATQNIAFGQAPANVTFGDPPVSVSATSTSPTAPPSLITITFSSTTTAVCTVSGTTVSIVAAGTCTIAADQPGNTNYNAATQVTQSFTIARATLTVSATATPSSFTYGDDVPPTPMTVVSYGATYSPPAACLLAPATATFSGQPPTSPANAGTYAIAPTITSAVSPSCDVVPVNATLTVNKAPTQFTVDSFVFTSLFSPTTIAGKLNRPNKPSVYPNALAIALSPSTTFPSTATPGAPDGTFMVTQNSVPSNTYAVTFSFAGNSNFLAAAPVTATLRVEGFSAAGDMTQARARHSSTLLDDGRVLIAGGFDGAFARAATSEVYCPDTMPDPPPAVAICPNGRGAFGLMGSLSAGSEGHTSTRLLNGKVLKVGGRNAVAELFDPATGQWTVLTAVLPGGPRTFHTATLLSCAGHCAYDGKVLITGGDDFVSAGDGRNNTLNSTLIFDPATNTFADGPPMSAARYVHSANLLPNGKVLIAGGEQKSGAAYVALDSAEIYDPTANPAACPPSTLGCMIPANAMTSLRFSHGATALADGRVLIAGGSNNPTGQRTGLLDTAEVYDYLSNTWTALTPNNQLGDARRSFPMTRLFDDWVLAAGGLGVDPNPRLSSSSLFEPGFNAFATGASLSTARARHKATRLLDGRVLITGGTIQVGTGLTQVDRDTAIGSAEFYNGPPPMP